MHAFLSLTSKDDLGPVHTYPYSFEKPFFFSPFSKKFASTRNVFASFSPVHTYKRILLTIVYIFPH